MTGANPEVTAQRNSSTLWRVWDTLRENPDVVVVRPDNVPAYECTHFTDSHGPVIEAPPYRIAPREGLYDAAALNAFFERALTRVSDKLAPNGKLPFYIRPGAAVNWPDRMVFGSYRFEDTVGWVDTKSGTSPETEYRLGPTVVLVPEGFGRLETGASIRRVPSDRATSESKPIIVTFPVRCYPSAAVEAWAARNDDKHSITLSTLEHLRA